nr:thioesterase family protein [uncultured Carboxylicivirga sp.]
MQEIEFHNSTSVQIRFNDIDSFGHVNNATLQEYFDLGRMHYIYDVFGDDFFHRSQSMIIASIHTDFVIPVFLRDQIEVKTAIVKIGTKSLNMEQHIVDIKTNKTKVICKSVMVAFDTKTQQAIEVLPEWREKIAEAEQWTKNV